MIRNTSVAALQELFSGGQIAERQEQILRYLARYKTMAFSRSEIAHNTGIELCSVTGRVTELITRGLLEEDASRQCTITQKTVNPVRISEAGLLALTYREAA